MGNSNGRSKYMPIALYYLVVQFIVTVGLLVFAFIVRAESPDISALIVGAVVGFWLGESPKMGKLLANGVADYREADPATKVTPRVP